MSVHPKNPVMIKGLRVPVLGHTRTNEGSLEWFDASLKRWRPAVRQHTIRDRLLQQANAQGSYRFPRGAGIGNNVTAPLAGDLDDGGGWANRPDRLFQLDPVPDQNKNEPATVLMDGDRVMLDPFDHPIRDFGNDLPMIISSEIKGWEVENYLRRNLAIKVYDLVARCPKNHTMGSKTYIEAPDTNTIRERATKFREQSGCLAWGKDRAGSANIRNYILSLLPTGATTTRSLGQDLTPAQCKARKAMNKGRHPERRRKAKRQAEAMAYGRIVKTKAGRFARKKRPRNVGYEPAKYREMREQEVDKGFVSKEHELLYSRLRLAMTL